jgi:rod shape-determining protein MreC
VERNRRSRIVLWLVILVVVLNLPVPSSMRLKDAVRDNVAPYQNVLTFVVTKLRNMFFVLGSAGAVVAEREELVREIAVLRGRIRESEATIQENRVLREKLAFVQSSSFRLVFCEVISRGGTSGWWQTLRLNKGTDHGIGPNMAVITEDGIVGRTGGLRSEEKGPRLHVSRRTCDVLLITDPQSRVACELVSARAFGVLRGRGVSMRGRTKMEMLYPAHHPRMEYIYKGTRVEAQERVVTSGLGGVYPKGVPVGDVLKMEMDHSGLYLRAEVRPAADLGSLRYVFVVVKQGAEGAP